MCDLLAPNHSPSSVLISDTQPSGIRGRSPAVNSPGTARPDRRSRHAAIRASPRATHPRSLSPPPSGLYRRQRNQELQ
jgi:hypothetical protein